jgi:predicted transcriptional regulator
MNNFLRDFVKEYFHKLTLDKGEDIFEYGMGDFDEEHFLKQLHEDKIIGDELYEELIEDDAELFQIIQEIDEYDYEKCLEVFTDYIVRYRTIEQITDIMVSAAS